MTDASQLDAEYFDVMANFARRHWWYVSRRALVADALAQLDRPGAVAVDVGCGTGETLDTLAALGHSPVVGTELSAHALERAGAGPGAVFMAAAAERLPFRDGEVGCMTSMDVVEHLDDAMVGLREYARVLAPGAPLVLTVPAYQWLFSAHDVRAHHRQRYSARELAREVEAAGITVLRTTYYNSFLVPPAILLRKTPLRRLGGETDEETSYGNPALNRVFGMLAALERAAVRRIRIPFGLSILLVGRRNAEPRTA